MPTRQKIIAIDFADNVYVFHEKLNGKIYGKDDIRRLMEKCADMGVNSIHWRTAATGVVTYRSKVRTRLDQAIESSAVPISLLPEETAFKRSPNDCWKELLDNYDPLEVAVEAAHEHGLEIYLYTTLFDEAYPGMESAFCIEYPEFCWKHRHFEHYNRGLLAYGHPEVRAYRITEIKELLSYGADGIYLDCARSHAGIWPLMCMPFGYDVYKNYGFNDSECAEYEYRTGVSPRLSNLGKVELSKIDWDLWQKIRGEFLTKFIREASLKIRQADQKLSVGFYSDAECYLSPAGQRGRQILGGLHIDCDTWIREELIDQVILIAEHRRFGLADWQNHSSGQFKEAQEKGIELCLWAATEQGIDELPDPPAPLPLRLTQNPELFMETVSNNVRRILESSADGVYMYEAAWLEEAELVHGWDYWGYLKKALQQQK